MSRIVYVGQFYYGLVWFRTIFLQTFLPRFELPLDLNLIRSFYTVLITAYLITIYTKCISLLSLDTYNTSRVINFWNFFSIICTYIKIVFFMQIRINYVLIHLLILNPYIIIVSKLNIIIKILNIRINIGLPEKFKKKIQN